MTDDRTNDRFMMKLRLCATPKPLFTQGSLLGLLCLGTVRVD